MRRSNSTRHGLGQPAFKPPPSGSQCIAVLRYDKSTFVHRGKLAVLLNLTVKEETVVISGTD